MVTGAVFFSRCRPQDSDPIDLVIRERRIFIGYPALRANVEACRDRLREAVIDLWCSDEEWEALRPGFGKDAKQYQQNRNFVRTIDPGAIALVPRPSRGVVYAGRVVGRFELLDDPPWADDYIELRRRQKLKTEDEPYHLADIAQCCEVDRFRAIPFPLVPAWIRRSLLGRSTYGRIWPMPELELDPYTAMDRLLDHPGGTVTADPGTDLLRINDEFTVSVVVSRCEHTPASSLRWLIRVDAGLRPDITVAVRMDTENRRIHDYYLLPAVEPAQASVRLREENGVFLDAFQFDTLDYLFRIIARVDVRSAA